MPTCSNKKNADDYEALRKALVAMRHEASLTQVQLAAKLGVPQQFISKYETSERRLDFIEARLVCDSCGSSVAKLAAMLDKPTS